MYLQARALQLYAYDEQYKDCVYPYACAIDTPLPQVAEEDLYHIMLNEESKANWAVAPPPDEKNHAFKEYPDISLEQWHKQHNVYIQ